MEVATLKVKLGSDNNNIVEVYGQTVAEAMFMEYIHGESSVSVEEITGETDYDPVALKEHMKSRFSGDNTLPKLEELFPGRAPAFATTFADSGLATVVAEAPAAKSKARKKPGPKPKVEKPEEPPAAAPSTPDVLD